MAGPMTSRSQRRMEKRQALMLLAIIFAVALTSFVLGVMVGRKGGAGPISTLEVAPPRYPVATSPQVQIQENPAPEVSRPEKLSFYETLPRGETQPLGSGINLPAQGPTAPEAEPKSATTAKPKDLPAPKPPENRHAPEADLGDAYLVQAASFRKMDEARGFQEKLIAKDFPAYVEKIDLGPKGIWFRVLAGPFKDPLQAQDVAVRIREEFRITPLVKKK